AIDVDSPDPRLRASALFLLRPPGWDDARPNLEEKMEGDAVARKLSAELNKAKRRIRRLENELAKAGDRAGAWEELLQSKLAHQAERLGKERKRRDLEIRQMELAMADLRARLDQTEQARTALTADLERLRKKQPRTLPPESRRRPVAWEPRVPLELARHLDDLAAAGTVSPRSAAVEARESVVVGVQLPTGLRPDRPEAIEWLLGQPQGIVVAIDGWNAAHLLSSPPTVAERLRVVEAGRRIGTASRGRRRVMIVFDSQEGSEQISNPEVEIIYVSSADQEILEMAERATSPLVVISSDRRVREESEAAGAVGLWSEALIDWLRIGGRRTFGA
ncbi:MAG TPA: hypothetical protein VM470_07155, partial [Acidimicrobiia bacterium]|nr:hypothetical protein [Acidimicrobiia bacterium]